MERRTTGTWTQRSSTGPSARDGHAIVYDNSRNALFLFSGSNYYLPPTSFDDIWESKVFSSADFDLNGYVDNDDFLTFIACTSGPKVPYDQGVPPGCSLVPDVSGYIAADFNQDKDVDQEDFGIFQRCISGADPADPDCTN